MFDSFVRYQTRLIRALDAMAKKYDFTTVDAARPPDAIFRELQRHISRLELRTMQEAPRPSSSNGGSRANAADASNGAKRSKRR